MRRDITGFAAVARDDGLRPGGQPGQGTILTPAQYETYAPWFASARQLHALTAELEILCLAEMTRAEGWANHPEPQVSRVVSLTHNYNNTTANQAT
jgi:hypothetical protein